MPTCFNHNMRTQLAEHEGDFDPAGMRVLGILDELTLANNIKK